MFPILLLRGKALVPVGLSLAFSTLAHTTQSVRVDASDDIMGTTFSVVLYDSNRVKGEAAANAALAEAHRLDHVLSNYLPSSELSRVNREAARAPVKVSAELFSFLDTALRYSRESEGAFDMTVGPLMKVWGFYKGEGRLPKPADVTGALKRVGYRHVILDRSERTVQFDAPGVELDPGGIGKGYAVDSMVAVLRQAGVSSARISAGGSSIYAIGTPPDEPRGWKTPIRAPTDARLTVAEVFLKNESISTSGGYEKFFRAEGKVYAHIMDPRTGYPAQGTAAVSVIAARTIDSEVWAKPYFINGRAWTGQHKDPSFRVFFCPSTPTPCSWIAE
jgi:FAD:protein FMN transferase